MKLSNKCQNRRKRRVACGFYLIMGFEEEYERAGIQHLFTSHPEAKAILPALYKSITKLNVANKSEKGEFEVNK